MRTITTKNVSAMKSMNVSKLLLMAGLHFVIMYVLMYSMVATVDHIHLNINKAYMAAIMTAPMLMLEIWLMGEMYADKGALKYVMALSAVALVAAFAFIRQQTFVGDKPFLRAMIPHHSSAILMCNQADIDDQEILDLCDDIVQTQEEEIAIMERILARLNEE
jgi:uncharacterized protein (DUF305 family)